MKVKFFLISLMVMVFSSNAFADVLVNFSDVGEDEWFFTPVMEIAKKGIINGYADGTFGPDNQITRAEVAKIVYAVDSYLRDRIESLEDRVASLEARLEAIDGETAFVPASDDEELMELEVEGELNELIKLVSVNLDSEKALMDGYAEFREETSQNFLVQYPETYFWSNGFGGLEDADGYVWHVGFSKNDFTDLTGEEALANVDMAVSVVYMNEVETDSEVQLFVEIDAEQAFLVEGDAEDLSVLEDMAESLTWI